MMATRRLTITSGRADSCVALKQKQIHKRTERKWRAKNMIAHRKRARGAEEGRESDIE